MEHRIYDKKEDIDSDKVKDFFEKRFIKDKPMSSIMLRGNAEDGVAEKRNENEMELLRSVADYTRPFQIFDIGCGLGRIADNLNDNIDYYDGIDFTENYVMVANENYSQKTNINFHVMSATNINKEVITRKYNLITITALMIYLNDEAIDTLMASIPEFTHNNAQVYIRESISILDKRLTLKDFYSDELDTDYNAIYRTQEEYEVFINRNLCSKGFEIISSELVLKGELADRKETNQMYWILKQKTQ